MEAIEFTLDDVSAYTDNFRREVGRGGFSVVYGGRIPQVNQYNLPEQKVAVKVNVNARDIQQFQEEIHNTPRGEVPNVVHLVGHCQTEDKVYLVLPRIEGCPLSDAIVGLTWDQVLKILKGIINGIQYFHNKEMVIGDLKPQNVLLHKDCTPRLCDFGTLAPVNSNIGITTYRYLDPLAKERRSRQKDDDVFSFGLIALQLLMKREHVIVPGRGNIVTLAVDLFRERGGDIVHRKLKRTGCTQNQAIAISRLMLNLVLRPGLGMPYPLDNLAQPNFRPSIEYVKDNLEPLRVSRSRVLVNKAYRIFS